MKLVDFLGEETELALEFIATLDVRDVTALKGSQLWVQIRELDHTQLAKVCQKIMCSILTHDQGETLHRFGTESPCHLVFLLLYNNNGMDSSPQGSSRRKNGGRTATLVAKDGDAPT
jgi:hypothetical protein